MNEKCPYYCLVYKYTDYIIIILNFKQKCDNKTQEYNHSS